MCCVLSIAACNRNVEPFVEGEHLVDASAKLKVADRLLKRLRARGSRVLLFSAFVQTLDVLQVAIPLAVAL